MLLGNLSAFMLAPLFASSMFTNFGLLGGPAMASTSFDNERWSTSSEERSSFFGDWGSRYWRDPAITAIDPDSGTVGTEVTLTGDRFREDSVVRFGEGSINDVDVSENGHSLSFTIPESMGRYCPPDQYCTQIAYDVTPGAYDVRVVSNDRTSDAVTFTVTEDDDGDNGEDDGLSIDHIDGPTSLVAGTEGSWNVAVDGASSTLSYSVVWGDENRGLRSLLRSVDETTQASATFTHTYQDPGTYTPEFTVRDATGAEVTKQAATVTVSEDGTVRIDSIDPAEARSGDTVTLAGIGFDGDTKVFVGQTEAAGVTVASDTSLTFTVPELSARSYRVRVTSDEGRSNAVALKVAPALKTRVSVSGVDAPMRLTTEEDGTWTVHAASNADGNLHYSVVWGDEGMTAMRRLDSGMTQASATFTHRYAAAGTYHPKFTVTDDNGNSASVSASVVVRTGG